jgi:hypothetical protein
VDVVERKFALPGNPWAKEEKEKMLGLMQMTNILDGMHGMTLAMFTKILGWGVEEVEVFLVNVRKDLQNKDIHFYYIVWVHSFSNNVLRLTRLQATLFTAVSRRTRRISLTTARSRSSARRYFWGCLDFGMTGRQFSLRTANTSACTACTTLIIYAVCWESRPVPIQDHRLETKRRAFICVSN